MKIDNNNTDPEYWDKILEKEWLWSLDKKEWFIQVQENKEKIIDLIDLNNIEEIEKKLKIKININKEDKKITLEDNNWYEIWRIEPWIFYMYNYEDESHLYKKIDESFRWKWYWTILMNLYKKYFELPKTEVSYKISTIRFLQKFWYNLKYKIINWNEYFITEEEKNEILYWEVYNDELSSVYKLILEE